ncbi:hypothetical protein PR048_016175 [Dryococelus australis]|uniref:Uncharacterized protein n=1 Tax=Dryococelus australis TaxID=614101 RepID=A0ABQ9HK46_9NEOP|nr:hypothetical protein PR048_016175 [Dryococelus australis]
MIGVHVNQALRIVPVRGWLLGRKKPLEEKRRTFSTTSGSVNLCVQRREPKPYMWKDCSYCLEVCLCVTQTWRGMQVFFPGRVTGFSHAGIVPDDAAGRRVFSVISRFPRRFIPAPLHPYSPQSPSSALKTLLLRAAQISISGLPLLRSVVQSQNGENFRSGFSHVGSVANTVVLRGCSSGFSGFIPYHDSTASPPPSRFTSHIRRADQRYRSTPQVGSRLCNPLAFIPLTQGVILAADSVRVPKEVRVDSPRKGHEENAGQTPLQHLQSEGPRNRYARRASQGEDLRTNIWVEIAGTLGRVPFHRQIKDTPKMNTFVSILCASKYMFTFSFCTRKIKQFCTQDQLTVGRPICNFHEWLSRIAGNLLPFDRPAVVEPVIFQTTRENTADTGTRFSDR